MDLFGPVRVRSLAEWNALLDAASKHADDLQPLMALIGELEVGDAGVKTLLEEFVKSDAQLSRLTSLLEAVFQADRAQWLARHVIGQHAKLLYRTLGLNQTPMALALFELLVGMASLDTHTQWSMLNDLDWSLPGWSKYATMRNRLHGTTCREQWIVLVEKLSQNHLSLMLKLPCFLMPIVNGLDKDDATALRMLIKVLERATHGPLILPCFTPTLLLKMPALLSIEEGESLWRLVLPRLVQRGRLKPVCDLLCLLQPLTNQQHESLIRDLLKLPALFHAYWSHAPFSWEPEATCRFLALCTLLSDTADHPIDEEVDLQTVWPRAKMNRALLTRCILHPTGLVQHASCLMLSRLLLRLQKCIFEMERRGLHFGGLDEIAQLLPDWQTILALLNRLAPEHPTSSLLEHVAASYARLWSHQLPERRNCQPAYQAMLILQGRSVEDPNIQSMEVRMALITATGEAGSPHEVIQRARGSPYSKPIAACDFTPLLANLIVGEEVSDKHFSIELSDIADEQAWWSRILDECSWEAIRAMLLSKNFTPRDYSSQDEFIKAIVNYEGPWAWLLLLRKMLSAENCRRMVETGMHHIILQAAAHGHVQGQECLWHFYACLEGAFREWRQLKRLLEACCLANESLNSCFAWSLGEAMRICLQPLHPIYPLLMEQLSAHHRSEFEVFPLMPQSVLITNAHLEGQREWQEAVRWTLNTLLDALNVSKTILSNHHHWLEMIQTLALIPSLDPSIKSLVFKIAP